MKDPFLSRRKKSNRAKKLELVCSFNGAFRPRPPSGDLRYTGGETRIITLVDRNIGFSRLKSKISELLVLRSNNGALSFSLKYQLPVEDDNEPPPPPLVLIASDDDVRCMIDEFDKLESRGMPTRLRIFVCHECDDDGFVNCVETTENLNGGCGFGGDTKVSRAKFFGESVNGFRFSSRDSMTHLCGCEFGGDEVENSATDVNGVRCSDDSLRKMVWKHLLAKQLDQIRSFRSAFGLAGKGFLSENQKYNRFKHSVSSNRATNGGGRYSFDRPYGSKDNLTGVDGRGVPQLQARNPIQCHFAPKDLLTGSSIDEKHDLSLCNLSLSSSKEVEPSACSFTTGNHVSEALPWPQSKPANLMDEEHISSGPQVETSNRVSACDSSFHNAAKSGKMDEQKEEMQQDHLSSLSSEEKVGCQLYQVLNNREDEVAKLSVGQEDQRHPTSS
ncbi:mitogen-activated protein kinase kinase kinase [Sarracenia purpurea var. burkii]